MQGKGKRPLPLHPIPKTNTNTKINTNNKIKVVYTEDWTHPVAAHTDELLAQQLVGVHQIASGRGVLPATKRGLRTERVA